MNIIIATMVKDEDDIIEYWIKYYGYIFGYDNLYIIDNYSTDKTYEICQNYIKFGINLFQKEDYKKKGEYMMEIKKNITCDFFIPVDIDEFIVYIKNNEINNYIINYFNILKDTKPNNLLFKMNYILPIKTNYNNNIFTQFSHGTILNNGRYNKTFIQNSIKNNIKIDHGNHLPNYKYESTDLYLIHFHQRTSDQHKKKIHNNITGLGYIIDINYLENLPKNIDGYHHVNMCLELLKNENKDNSPTFYNLEDIPFNNISLNNFIHFINNI